MSSGSSVGSSLLGTANNLLGMVNISTLVISLFLSIMVINNYNQCTSDNLNKGIYNQGFTRMSYIFSIIIIIIVCLLMVASFYLRVVKK